MSSVEAGIRNVKKKPRKNIKNFYNKRCCILHKCANRTVSNINGCGSELITFNCL